ncbi:midnolin homolog [Anopheles nili]|uniref:midnolin homolog n=1 Tax=Anopheles nili TaxID=185578 RepID=UPI00237B4600|nr:midnolin homolog [Anopheles nili]
MANFSGGTGAGSSGTGSGGGGIEDTGSGGPQPSSSLSSASLRRFAFGQAGPISLDVATTTGGNFSLIVDSEQTVEQLKKIISKKLKVSKDRICLLHRERELNDGTLRENGLIDGSKIILTPNVETGLLAQRAENTVMQALESLNDNQVNDFLSGKCPLNLNVRLGDHMMLIQLQLSTLNPSAQAATTGNSSTSTSTSSHNISNNPNVSTSNNANVMNLNTGGIAGVPGLKLINAGMPTIIIRKPPAANEWEIIYPSQAQQQQTESQATPAASTSSNDRTSNQPQSTGAVAAKMKKTVVIATNNIPQQLSSAPVPASRAVFCQDKPPQQPQPTEPQQSLQQQQPTSAASTSKTYVFTMADCNNQRPWKYLRNGAPLKRPHWHTESTPEAASNPAPSTAVNTETDVQNNEPGAQNSNRSENGGGGDAVVENKPVQFIIGDNEMLLTRRGKMAQLIDLKRKPEYIRNITPGVYRVPATTKPDEASPILSLSNMVSTRLVAGGTDTGANDATEGSDESSVAVTSDAAASSGCSDPISANLTSCLCQRFDGADAEVDANGEANKATASDEANVATNMVLNACPEDTVTGGSAEANRLHCTAQNPITRHKAKAHNIRKLIVGDGKIKTSLETIAGCPSTGVVRPLVRVASQKLAQQQAQGQEQSLQGQPRPLQPNLPEMVVFPSGIAMQRVNFALGDQQQKQQQKQQPATQPQAGDPTPMDMDSNVSSLENPALAEASRNLTQTLRKLSKSVFTNKVMQDVAASSSSQSPLTEPTSSSSSGSTPSSVASSGRGVSSGAIIESMKHHGKGIYSGTFSGTLNPALQDKFGRPKRDISTIIHILNDLLSAAPQCARNTSEAVAKASAMNASTATTSTGANPPANTVGSSGSGTKIFFLEPTAAAAATSSSSSGGNGIALLAGPTANAQQSQPQSSNQSDLNAGDSPPTPNLQQTATPTMSKNIGGLTQLKYPMAMVSCGCNESVQINDNSECKAPNIGITTHGHAKGPHSMASCNAAGSRRPLLLSSGAGSAGQKIITVVAPTATTSGSPVVLCQCGAAMLASGSSSAEEQHPRCKMCALKALELENSKTKLKLDNLRKIMQKKKERREARRQQAAPYNTSTVLMPVSQNYSPDHVSLTADVTNNGKISMPIGSTLIDGAQESQSSEQPQPSAMQIESEVEPHSQPPVTTTAQPQVQNGGASSESSVLEEVVQQKLLQQQEMEVMESDQPEADTGDVLCQTERSSPTDPVETDSEPGGGTTAANSSTSPSATGTICTSSSASAAASSPPTGASTSEATTSTTAHLVEEVDTVA